MEWYTYLACFFAGAFLANFVPHFVKGVCGDKFPSPFAKPPGKGLSSAPLNVVWGLFNLLIGVVLFRAGHIRHNGLVAWVVVFIGFALMSIMASVNFQKKDRE